MRITENRVYFWAGPLSNWVKVKGGILVPGKYNFDGETDFRLPTSEHVFMFLKATFFHDPGIAKSIMQEESPKEAKRLGRRVQDFEEDKWKEYREIAMWKAISLRYKSDPSFQKYLVDERFRGKVFVEANPYDMIWSCGYLEDDPRCDMPENTWPGLNLLGKLLTKLRDEKLGRAYLD